MKKHIDKTTISCIITIGLVEKPRSTKTAWGSRAIFFTLQKSECADSDILEAKITKEIKAQLEKRVDYWHSFDKIIIYYDNGQKPLKRILNILFNTMFANVEVRKISPVDYKLFQVADLICTLEHIKAKIDIGQFSNSEKEFFGSPHLFKKDYWRKLSAQRM